MPKKKGKQNALSVEGSLAQKPQVMVTQAAETSSPEVEHDGAALQLTKAQAKFAGSKAMFGTTASEVGVEVLDDIGGVPAFSAAGFSEFRFFRNELPYVSDKDYSDAESSSVSGSERSNTERERKRRERKVWTEESLARKAMYDEMRGLVPKVKLGEDVRNVRNKEGKQLTFAERCVLLRLVPQPEHRLTGRLFTRDTHGKKVDTTYDCKFNLAGSLFVATLDGVMMPIELPSTADDCGHSLCAGRVNIRRGGDSDKLVIVVPKKSTELPRGVMSSDGVGTVAVWRQLYRQAVFGLTLAKAGLNAAKYRALLGHKYIPRSKFGEVVLFMTKMLGLQDLAFYDYESYPGLFDAMLAGKPGSSHEFELLVDHSHSDKIVRLTNYAWGLYHLCQLQSVEEDMRIPLAGFFQNIDKMSRRTTKALQMLMAIHNGKSGLVEIDTVVRTEITLSSKDQVDDSVEAARARVAAAELRRKKCEANNNIPFPVLETHVDCTSALAALDRVLLLQELFSADDIQAMNLAYARSGLVPKLPWYDHSSVRESMKYDRSLSEGNSQLLRKKPGG